MESKITVEGTVTNSINFAMQQNYVPVFRNFIITNNTETEIENVSFKVSFEPEFASLFTTTIPKLTPGKPVEVTPIRIIVSPDYLFSLTEKILGNVHIEIVTESECLYTQDEPIELLAYDEWTGCLFMPEIIAAFVTPNSPRVAEVVAKASMFLNKWTDSPSFTGYQTKNPNIVKKQIGAIYAALQEENIAYNMPPASYEMMGQRIRLASTVLEQKSGTCLDLSILFISCLEAIGLNPIIVMIKGHAFAGCWLEESTFAECVEDDISAITKRVAGGIDQLCLVECTDFVAGKSISFDKSEKHGNDHLLDNDRFEMVIDISRCRGSGIRPMPSRVLNDGKFTSIDYGKRDEDDITVAPKEINLTIHGESGEAREITRQDIWERKLLDLSLRNSLLNFRANAGKVQFMTADLPKLEDEISRGEDFKIMPLPHDFIATVTDSKIFEIENEKDMITAIAESEFKSKRLRTFLTDLELEKTLKKLHRQARVSLEENGANTLYLALGFLRWFETDLSERIRYAPLILIPVDIIKKIQNKSYSLRIRDEEIQMNITLLEMLRQDFGINITGLNPLPQDESGVDMQLVFNTVRQGIMSKRNWDIEEFAFLGQFSFNQFIMWNDIRNNSDLLKENKVVSSLISGKIQWTPENIYIAPKELDDKVTPSDMAVPTSADSSQLAAIYEASQGQTFVLHGPPGTGKSQTITNMIANALYNGKSVLFVAEKMAALSVVQKRLEKIGLAPFCLELHSNKAQKKAVLNQLEKTLAVGSVKSPEEYATVAENLRAIRNELNGVMDELHKPRTIGHSLYEAIVAYENNKQFKDTMCLSNEFVESCDKETYLKLKDSVRKTATAAKQCSDDTIYAFRNYHNQNYSFEIRDKLEKVANELNQLIKLAESNYGTLSMDIQAGFPTAIDDYLLTAKVLADVCSENNLLSKVIDDSDFVSKKSELANIILSGKRLRQLHGEIERDFEQAIFSFDADIALLKWKNVQQKWFLPKTLGLSKLVKEFGLYSKVSGKITKDNIINFYEKLSEYKRLNNYISTIDVSFSSFFGGSWASISSDFDMLEKSLISSEEIRNIIGENSKIKFAVVKLLGNPELKTKAKSLIEKVSNDSLKLKEILDLLSSEFLVDVEKLNTENCFATISDESYCWSKNISSLREYTLLENSLSELHVLGIGNVADSLKEGKVSCENLVAAFDCEINKAMVSCVFSDSPKIASFHGAQFDDEIAKYAEVSDKFEELTIQELVSRLSSKIPANSPTQNGTSELAILQKAIRSGGRMMPIRKLFDSIPNLIRRICPCMLMSPISVAQYIDPSYPKFDLVVFDEASQLPTCEAVGAIARGENVVIVGDPKQLPPTSFFMTNQIDEENYDKEDLESVLDDCLALAMPEKHLLWHYRSRHESLIAYSNTKYYENKLMTFPSPDDLVSEVTWVKVEGYYDKGKTRQNIAEAEAIVQEIVRRISDDELRKESIGVVTFSVVQQVLIDDLLSEEFCRNPEIELLANQMYEPIFIKNLENVQGDERDVILFSIGYGPDQNGKVSMNFGPLNRDGGWRRLNVAISRSRKKMQIYSVITPEQIDLSRTRSDGVEGLKGFLEFAAKGKNALAVRSSTIVTEDDGFDMTVADKIKSLGYDVKCDIGSSEYKIDIGIVNPDNTETYILGILCDSKKHFDTATARDRNILQPKVLKGLGWNVYNLHIIDWLENPDRVVEDIRQVVEKVLNDYRENPQKKALPEVKKQRVLTFETVKVQTPADKCEEYTPFVSKVLGSSNFFNETSTRPEIITVIKDIVNAEGPISNKALTKNILSCWGITRSGSRMQRTINEAIQVSGVKSNKSNDTVFYWRDDQEPHQYDKCRISKVDISKRSLDDVCSEEIANGIVFMLTSHISMHRTDLVREIAKLFGFARMGGVIETSVNNGIACAINQGKISCDENDRISLAI